VRHGRLLPAGSAAGAEGPVALLAEGRLVAVARPEGGARLRPAVVLA
jgi:hypothetical protein